MELQVKEKGKEVVREAEASKARILNISGEYLDFDHYNLTQDVCNETDIS